MVEVEIDSRFVGYGCTEEKAKRAFLKRVLEEIYEEADCRSGTCDDGHSCLAKIIDTADLVADLTIDATIVLGCDNDLGYMCFLHDDDDSTSVEGKCTCVPESASPQ